MRICHVVESMDKGAVENWLLRTFMHSRRDYPDVQWTFYCTLPDSGRMAKLCESCGARVIASPVPFGQTRSFMKHLRAHLKANPCDVLHCHHDFLSGFYLLASLGLPIHRRWVHVHNTDEALPTPSRMKHRLLLEPLRQVCLRVATGIVGISNHVLDQFLRHKPRRLGRDVVVYYGVDEEPFQHACYEPEKFRSELGLPIDAKILLFMGRMAPIKNPVFVVDVLAAIQALHPGVFAVFAGEGELVSEVRSRADSLGISERIRILGWRDDSAYLMKNSDVFVFPRPEVPKEGLGLVVVEAQACGLPMITSQGICDDAIVNTAMVTRLPLTTGASVWAEAVNDCILRTDRRVNVSLANSHFGMDRATSQLMELSGVQGRVD